MLQECVCGSRKFKASITLELVGVPVELKADGSLEYDDIAADYSEGWNTADQPEIQCATCHATYDLEQLDEVSPDGLPTYELRPMDAAPPATPGRDEEGG